jgi:hypothetical protein
MERLVASDPRNVSWNRDLMLAYGHAADVLGNPGRSTKSHLERVMDGRAVAGHHDYVFGGVRSDARMRSYRRLASLNLPAR